MRRRGLQLSVTDHEYVQITHHEYMQINHEESSSFNAIRICQIKSDLQDLRPAVLSQRLVIYGLRVGLRDLYTGNTAVGRL